MRKKILLSLTIIISMIVGVNSVMAAVEYSCPKKNYNVITSYAGSTLSQPKCCPANFSYGSRWNGGVETFGCFASITDKEKCKNMGGKISTFGGDKECFASSENALIWGGIKVKNVNNSSQETVEKCELKGDKCIVKLAQLDDTNNEIFVGYSKDSNCSNIISNSIHGTSINLYKEDVSEIYACYDKTYVKCYYEDNISIIYGEKFIKTYTNNKLDYVGMDKSIMDLYYESKKYCPTTIFHYGDKGMEKFSVTKSGACPILPNVHCKSAKLKDSKIIVENTSTIVTPPNKDIKSCEDLFSEKTRAIIDSIMKWIRIFVPILLIGLGILDFTKAVFSKSEDDMKKSREKFIKRIIAAVAVFLVPIFVNLILDLANMAWNNISSDTCIR